MPALSGILETCLYVDDMARAHAFYSRVMGLDRILEDGERISVYEVQPTQVLILFKRGGTLQPVATAGGIIPPHDGSGPSHIAFCVAESEMDAWQRHLEATGTVVESVVEWPRGGRSIYFRDPDSHALELGTPNLWSRLR